MLHLRLVKCPPRKVALGHPFSILLTVIDDLGAPAFYGDRPLHLKLELLIRFPLSETQVEAFNHIVIVEGGIEVCEGAEARIDPHSGTYATRIDLRFIEEALLKYLPLIEKTKQKELHLSSNSNLKTSVDNNWFEWGKVRLRISVAEDQVVTLDMNQHLFRRLCNKLHPNEEFGPKTQQTNFGSHCVTAQPVPAIPPNIKKKAPEKEREKENDTDSEKDKESESEKTNNKADCFYILPVISTPITIGTFKKKASLQKHQTEKKKIKSHKRINNNMNAERQKYCERHFVLSATSVPFSLSALFTLGRYKFDIKQIARMMKKETVIIIREEWDRYLGGHLWDAAFAMCHFLCEYFRSSQTFFISKRVLELGSGCGLVGLCAAFLGADITMTDMADIVPTLLANVNRNLKQESGIANVEELDWQNDAALHSIKNKKRWDIILATDVLYSPSCFELFLRALEVIADQHSIILVGYKKRSEEETFHFDKVREQFIVECAATYGPVNIFLWTKKAST
jgi:predicted nicotinamide N-methyase